MTTTVITYSLSIYISKKIKGILYPMYLSIIWMTNPFRKIL